MERSVSASLFGSRRLAEVNDETEGDWPGARQLNPRASSVG